MRQSVTVCENGTGASPGEQLRMGPGQVPWRLVIELQHVTKLYPASGRPALDDVSTEIDKGEFVFLIGSSGSGKSTFLRLLLKEDDPTSGTVRVNGQTLNGMSKWKVPKLRRTIGCVFQDFRLLRNRTVAENVAFALEVIGKPHADHPPGGARGAGDGRPRRQGHPAAARALRW